MKSEIQKQDGAHEAGRSSLHEVLDSLRGRFKERAKMSVELEASFCTQKNHVEALKCAIRRDIWEYAAEMVEQEKLSND